MNYTRRKLVSYGLPGLAALAVLAGCAGQNVSSIATSTTNYYDEVGSSIAASSIALTVLTGLVQSGVIKKTTSVVGTVSKTLTVLDGLFKSAAASAASGASLSAAVVAEIVDNLGVLKGVIASNPPTAAQVSLAKVAHNKFLLEHPKASTAQVVAIITLVLQYLPQIISVGTASYAWVQSLIAQINGSAHLTAQNIADDYTAFTQAETAWASVVA